MRLWRGKEVYLIFTEIGGNKRRHYNIVAVYQNYWQFFIGIKLFSFDAIDDKDTIQIVTLYILTFGRVLRVE